MRVSNKVLIKLFQKFAGWSDATHPARPCDLGVGGAHGFDVFRKTALFVRGLFEIVKWSLPRQLNYGLRLLAHCVASKYKSGATWGRDSTQQSFIDRVIDTGIGGVEPGDGPA